MKDDLARRLRFCTTLPTLPAVAVKIIDLANDPDADINTACQYISLDPALAAKILKTANSPLYKSRRAATNVRQAVSVLGTHSVIVIALSFSLANSLMKHPGQYPSVFDNNMFWRHSITSALACRALGEKVGLNIPDDLLLAGLLQEIGILALNAIMPDEYESIFASTPDHDTLLRSERETLGVGHDEIGYALLKQWHIPDYIALACTASHTHPPPTGVDTNLHACVAVSRYMADYFLEPSNPSKAAALTEAATSWLDLNGDALKDVIDKMGVGLSSVEDLFEIAIYHPSEITGILSEAKELLTIQMLSRVQELEEKSQRDSLTGARNRGFFDETLKREFSLSIQNTLPLTIAMIDLDHFKNINDTYGHLVGDAMLVAVVSTIYGQIRQDDTLSRYGGEEFAIILPGTPLSSARKLMARLKDCIAAITHKLENNQSVSMTASIGIASLDDSNHFEQPANLIKAADLALYAAKNSGRNQIVEWDSTFN